MPIVETENVQSLEVRSQNLEVRDQKSEVRGFSGCLLLTAYCLFVTLHSACSTLVWAAGLSTAFGEVLVENLKIGQSYNLRELVNLPLRIVNSSEFPMNIQMETNIPRDHELKEGYEAIPDQSWIKIVKELQQNVGPQEFAETDVILVIPNDKKLLGRRFQGYIYSHSVGSKRFVEMGLRSRILLTISPTELTEDEKKKLGSRKSVANLNFEFVPSRFEISEVAIGRKFNLKKEKKRTLKIINNSEEEVTYLLRSVPVREVNLPNPPDVLLPPSSKNLTFEKDTLTVPPGEIAEVPLVFDFPEEGSLRGKVFVFFVEAIPQGYETKVSIYGRIHVTTKKE